MGNEATRPSAFKLWTCTLAVSNPAGRNCCERGTGPHSSPHPPALFGLLRSIPENFVAPAELLDDGEAV